MYIHTAELERRKNEKLREERIIEKVRNEAPELRELEQKLRAAYMNQVRMHDVCLYHNTRTYEKPSSRVAGTRTEAASSI